MVRGFWLHISVNPLLPLQRTRKSATINKDILPRYIAGLNGAKIGAQLAELLGLAEPPGRVAGGTFGRDRAERLLPAVNFLRTNVCRGGISRSNREWCLE